MKKLLHPIIVTLITLTLLFSLPFFIKQKNVTTWSDKKLRQIALNGSYRAIPKDYKGLLELLDTPDNTLTKEKIALGKMLFFENMLSYDKSINCSSCHLLNSGGDDNLPTAIGYNAQANPFHLNSPTVLNSALQKYQFWDARAKSVEEQAAGPIQAPFEMHMKPKDVESRLNANSNYKELFKNIFNKDKIEFEDVQKAIGAYERTLLTYSPYDSFLDGNNSALNSSAKRGMTIFLSKGCAGCHSGIAVGGQQIQHFPVRTYLIDYIGVLINPELSIKDNPFPFDNIGGFLGKNNEQNFKVPMLREIANTAPYFHNGSVKELKEAVRVMSKYQLGNEFSKRDIEDVVSFLKSLSGEIVEY